MSEAEVVGREPCPFCDAVCEVRRSKKNASKLKIMCDGAIDTLACGTRIFLGKRPSHDRLKAAAEAERQPPADPRPEPKTSDTDPTESVERDQGLH